jgi:hypothetical protein
VMLLSSVIAELLKSTLPTLLRIASANQKSGETRN